MSFEFFLKKMSVIEAVFFGEKFLSNLKNPRLETEILLSEILQKNRTWLKINNDKFLKIREKFRFLKYLKKRQKHIPMAYIFDYKNWCGLRILVNKNVLIPRDETEILMNIIKNEKRSFIPSKILEIGSGSGCISIFLSKLFEQNSILSLDISRKSLKIAKKNSLENNCKNITFKKSDMLSVLKNKEKFDIMVANLPYVPVSISVSAEVKKEPKLAIFSKDGGLFHIKKLNQEIYDKNIIFRELWLEFLPSQKKVISEIFQNYKIKFFNDCGEKTFFAKIFS